MKDDVRYANEKSGLDFVSPFFLTIMSFMFGTLLTVGILCDFGQPTPVMTYLMIGTLIPFFIIAFIFVWAASIRDKMLKKMRENK